MIKTTAMIINELHDYKSPADKLKRLVDDGTYIPIVRGMYETDKSTPGYYLAESIYGPSYLSFEFALSYYGLIPEAVYTFTSATFNKKKKKQYETPFGTFLYRDVPCSVYPYGINVFDEGEYCYKMASPEKAICDQLYKVDKINNFNEMEAFLFDDLRIDEYQFRKLKMDDIIFLSEKYHCINVKRLAGYMRRAHK